MQSSPLFELSAEPAGSIMIVGTGGRRSQSAALCASITATLRPAPALAVLAQDAQHSLVMAAAFVQGFVTRGGTQPLRRRRHNPAPKPAAEAAPAAPPAAAAAAKTGQRRGVQHFLAGGIAGAVSKTLVAPMERVSTMLMADSGRFSVGQAARHACRDGVGGLYRGHTATLIKIFPASAIQFAVFNGVKDRILARRQQPATAAAATQQQQQQQRAGSSAGAVRTAATAPAELANHERLLAGAAAGAAAACACYPLESMRTMMSVAGGMRGNLLQVGRSVVAAHGLGALYRGFRASLLGDVLGNSLGFTAYEIGTRIFTNCNGGVAPPPHLRGVIGACSAACVVTLTMPLEVVRRRLQIQGMAGRPVLYRGTLHCLSTILRQEGVEGFYAASLPSYLKVAPSIGCMYFLYELIMTKMTALPQLQLPAAAAAAALPAADPAAVAAKAPAAMAAA